jgi:ParB-like chromosome segregation protein Spo0J
MNIQEIEIDKLIPYHNNPRKNQAVDKVASSISQFGWRTPIVVDEDMIILAGHTRFKAGKKLGLDVVPVHIAKGLSEGQKKAYRIADNRVTEEADWDLEFLKIEFGEIEDLLNETGFDQNEINKILEEEDEDIQPKIKFSEELDESHNYLVLYFDNDIDWLTAQTHFNVESVYSKRSNGKPWSKGIGRVINGSDYLNEIEKF